MFLLWIIAQTVEPNLTNSIQEWISTGVAGAAVVGFMFGAIVPGFIYKNSEAKQLAVEKKYDDLQSEVKRDLIPTLIKNTNILAETVKILERVSKRLDQ